MTSPPDIVMPERPKSDALLDERIALAALQEQFPAETFRHVERLGSGWATDVYLVNEDLVARFPRNADLARWIDKDESILTFVASTLGSTIRVPVVKHRGQAGTHFPHAFLVCTLVPGSGADRLEAPMCDGLARDLGTALTQIHSVSAEAAARSGIDRPEWDDYRGPVHFIHGDFSPDNLMVDRGTGRLIGVIDWGNAAIGDPALDFVPLVLWRGWDFARAVVKSYGLSTGHDFVGRIRRKAQIQALQWLTDTVKRQADPELHLTWLKNAFDLRSAS
jgi:aminoglycoside phosphotransferase (APT) family kinase protein